MRGTPPSLLSTALASVVVVVAFVTVVYINVKRARDPRTVPRDPVDRRLLPLLKNPSRREKLLFVIGLLVAAAAPWLTYVLER
jgi:hypothetical protein